MTAEKTDKIPADISTIAGQNGASLSERDALYDDTQQTSQSLGERIVALRLKHGFSQRELARRASVTNSTLSTIEQGKVSPSVSSLEKILNAFPISFEAFFSSATLSAKSVFKPDDLAKVDIGTCEIHMLSLGDSSIDGCYFAKHRIAPFSQAKLNWLNNIGVVTALVCEGELVVIVEGKKQTLLAGDVFHFSLKRDHKILNETDSFCLLACSFLPH